MPHYSKQSRLVRHVYTVTASANFGALYAPFSNVTTSSLGGYTGFVAASGSYVNNYVNNPRTITFDVPDHGKIVDAKVWIEFIHDNRSSASLDQLTGLGNIALSLRSPNVRFFSAHPIQNNVLFVGRNLSLLDPGLPPSFPIFELYKSSYLLWDGIFAAHNYGEIGGAGMPDPNALAYSIFAGIGDRDMRVTFTDASSYPNPRHVETLFPSASDVDPGAARRFDLLSSSVPAQLFYDIERYPNPATNFISFPGLWEGRDIPWFYDPRIPPCGITGTTYFTGSFGHPINSPSGTAASGVLGLGLSPPPGWLTGPGGTAAVGEFATTGSQIGRPTMRPVYPLLDDVVVEHVWDDPNGQRLPNVDPDTVYIKNGRFPGTRPGLRGTEAQGRWALMLATGNYTSASSGQVTFAPAAKFGVWFRQARLELLIDQGERPNALVPQSEFRYKKTDYVPAREDGKRIRSIISGTAFWDAGIDYVYTVTQPQYGRTVGITDHTGSSLDSFAVFAQVTGALVDKFSDDFDLLANIRATFLRNEFGTPYVPLSSGSGISPSFNPLTSNDAAVSRIVFTKTLRPEQSLGGSTVRSTLSRTGFFTPVADQLLENIASASNGTPA